MPTAIVRTPSQLGPILRGLRKERGLTQAALGSRMGLSQERISVIENHPERVTFDQLLTLLMVLDAEIEVRPREEAPPTEGVW